MSIDLPAAAPRRTLRELPLTDHVPRPYDGPSRDEVLALRRASARWPGRFLSIRYEDLVADPEGRVREVCSFLGLDFDPEMLGVSWCNTAERGQRDTNQGEGFVATSIGRWQRVLTPTEVEAMWKRSPRTPHP